MLKIEYSGFGDFRPYRGVHLRMTIKYQGFDAHLDYGGSLVSEAEDVLSAMGRGLQALHKQPDLKEENRKLVTALQQIDFEVQYSRYMLNGAGASYVEAAVDRYRHLWSK